MATGDQGRERPGAGARGHRGGLDRRGDDRLSERLRGARLAWRESDAGDYLHNFEHSPLAASEDQFMFEPAADEEQERARSTLEAAFVTEELEPFLAETVTQALRCGTLLW